MASLQVETALAFVNGKKSRQGNFHTDGVRLYTYAVQLAHREPDGAIVLDVPRDWRYSVTSARHFKTLLYVLDARDAAERDAERRADWRACGLKVY